MTSFNPEAKLLHHAPRVEDWLHSGKSVPIMIEIAPTGYCNASCPWCFFRGKHTRKHLDKATMLRVINDLAPFVKAINWTGGGEPTLHPDFKRLVADANCRGYKQGLFTNGYREIPCQEMFSWIRISMTPKGFESIKRPRVPFGICVNLTDEIPLEEWCLEAMDFGASYFQVRPALVGDYKKQPKIAAPEFLKKYEGNGFRVELTPYKFEEATKPKAYSKCYGYHFCPSLDWNGNLGPCLYMMDKGQFVWGNLLNDKFWPIWQRIPKYHEVIPECQNCCKNHEINKILYSAKNVEHPEFI